ncbi:ATP-binding protein [Patescibacteria group bacterium]|nr:ATP-binding protein [Patescibacteria group bacterium]
MKISEKVVLFMFASLLVLVGMLIYAVGYIDNNKKFIQQDVSEIQKRVILVDKLHTLQNAIQQNVLSYKFDNDHKRIETINKDIVRLNKIMDEMKGLIKTKEEKKLVGNYEQVKNDIGDLRISLIYSIDQGDAQKINEDFLKWSLKKEEMGLALQKLEDFNSRSLKKVNIFYENLVGQVATISIALVILAVILITLLYFYLRKTVTLPIEKLALSAEKISQGNLSFRIPTRSHDELGSLANSLKHMSINLKHYYRSLERDVQEKNEVIKKTKQADEIKDNFISIASHELRTPITSLKIYAQLMQKIAERNHHSDYKKYLTKMNEQLLKLTDLISGLLNVSRMQSGKLEFNNKLFDLNKVVGDVVEMSQELSEHHKIVLRGRINKKIYGDEERIYQVANNLMSNAVKYSPEGGKVIITLHDKGNEAEVSIRDYGIGIEKKYHGKIFDKFFRVKEEFPGLGIGLYLSSEIIRRHNGSLRVESAKGKGSNFVFSLPYKSKIN